MNGKITIFMVKNLSVKVEKLLLCEIYLVTKQLLYAHCVP